MEAGGITAGRIISEPAERRHVMKRYKVSVMETYRKELIVNANSETEAHQRAYDAWSCAEFVLDENDFEGAEVYVIGETENAEGMIIDSKEV